MPDGREVNHLRLRGVTAGHAALDMLAKPIGGRRCRRRLRTQDLELSAVILARKISRAIYLNLTLGIFAIIERPASVR